MMRRAARSRLCAVLLAALAAPAAAGDDGLDTAAGILRVALPVAALAGTWIADDPDGRRLWLLSTGASLASAYTLKAAISKQRPDGSGDDAFPSGHATAAFAGAAFLDRRYGHRVGAPAYALASWVAWSRVETDAHDTLDVVAGAALATGLTYWLVSARPERPVTFAVAPVGSGFGVRATLRFR